MLKSVPSGSSDASCASTSYDGWDEGNWITWHDSWRDYVQERHHACAAILEKEGYDIIFASPCHGEEEDVWEFSTASYRIRVWKSTLMLSVWA